MPNDLSPQDIARRGYSLALKRLSERKATHVAQAMGISDATVSKLKTEQLEQAIALLAHLGLKVTPVDFRCVDPVAYEFFTRTIQRTMAQQPSLLWGEEGGE